MFHLQVVGPGGLYSSFGFTDVSTPMCNTVVAQKPKQGPVEDLCRILVALHVLSVPAAGSGAVFDEMSVCMSQVRPPRPHVVKRPKSNIGVEGRRTSVPSPEQ